MEVTRTSRTHETWGAAAGLIMLACTMGGFALMAAGGLVARPDGTSAQIAQDVADPISWPARVGLFLDVVGSLLLVVFAARVALAIRPRRDSPPLLPLVVMGTALLAVAASFVDKAAFQVLALRAGEDLPTSTAVLLVDLISASFLLFQAAFAAFVLSASAGLLQQQVGPAWLGRSGVAVGLLGLAAVGFPAGSTGAQLPFPLLVLWVAVLSGVLIRDSRAPVEVATAGALRPAHG